jgi:hypothetical protein
LEFFYDSLATNVAREDGFRAREDQRAADLDDLVQARESRFSKSERFRLLMTVMDHNHSTQVARMVRRDVSREALDAGVISNFDTVVAKRFRDGDYRPVLPFEYELPDDVDVMDACFTRGPIALRLKYVGMKTEYNRVVSNFNRSGQNKMFADFVTDEQSYLLLIHAYACSGKGVEGCFSKLIGADRGGFDDGLDAQQPPVLLHGVNYPSHDQGGGGGGDDDDDDDDDVVAVLAAAAAAAFGGSNDDGGRGQGGARAMAEGGAAAAAGAARRSGAGGVVAPRVAGPAAMKARAAGAARSAAQRWGGQQELFEEEGVLPATMRR